MAEKDSDWLTELGTDIVEQYEGETSAWKRLDLEERGYETGFDESKVDAQTLEDLKYTQEQTKINQDFIDQWEAGGGPLTAGHSLQTYYNHNAAAKVWEDKIRNIEKRVASQGVVYNKTEERIQQDADRKAFAEQEKDLFQKKIDLANKTYDDYNSKEAVANRQAQKDLDTRYQGILNQQMERQEKALAGELPVSEEFSRQKQKDFDTFKEAQARAGNIVTGDTPENATAKGTQGAAALSKFKERFGIIEDQQRRGVITGEQGLLQSGLFQSGQRSISPFMQGNPQVGGMYGNSRVFQGSPNYGQQYGGLMGLNSAALNPFMQQQAWAMNQGGSGKMKASGPSLGQSMLSGATSGATIGTAVSPGWGTAWGAGIGLLGGAAAYYT